MKWVYLIVLVSASLSLYFLYHDYRKNKIPKKAFVLVCSLEAVAMAGFISLLLMSSD